MMAARETIRPRSMLPHLEGVVDQGLSAVFGLAAQGLCIVHTKRKDRLSHKFYRGSREIHFVIICKVT